MRTRTSIRSRRRAAIAWRAALLAAGALALSGCATLRSTVGGYEAGRSGISRPQQRLRDALVHGDFPTALAWRDDDALLRGLTMGISSYYASQFGRSAALLDSAALLADDRITASVSRNALALLTNDMARPYQPRRTERLFIPYYGMLSFAQLGDWEDAAVEARRLVSLLAQYADGRDDSERATHAAMHYLAGAVFERAGERNEAAVAYRAAHALSEGYREAVQPAPAGQGEVVVIVERGFVAHRATEAINLYLGEDRDSLRAGDEVRARAATRITERVWRMERDLPRSRGPRVSADRDDDDSYWLSVAFPALRRSPRPRGGDPRLVVDGAEAEGMRVVALVDEAAAADERRERAGVVTRSLARAAAKYAVTKAVRDKKGEVAGTLANIGVSLLERADVRSWHLLPQEIAVLRVRLPAGTHQLRLDLGDRGSERGVAVGSVTVQPGVLAIAALRLWRDPPEPLSLAGERTVAAR